MQREYGGQPATIRSRERRRMSWGPWTGIAAVAILIIVVAAILLASRNASFVTTDVTPDEIAADPAGLVDESVVTSGSVRELLTGYAMTISSDSDTEPVLVLLSPNALVNGAPPATGGLSTNLLREDDPVQLFGTVGSFDRQAMGDALGLVLHEDLFDAWEGAPVIVADQLETAPLASLDPAGAP